MNIIQYREMVAEEAANASATQSGTEQVTADTTTNADTTQAQTTDANTQTKEPTVPTVVNIEGIGEVPIEELTKGYLRQSDYTRKTQELASLRNKATVAQQVYESITANPELSQELNDKYGVNIPDPTQTQMIDITNKYNDLLLEREIEQLTGKYKDFDTQQVLQFAFDNKHQNLEDAYLLMKSKAPNTAESIDVKSLTEQIRQQVMNELKSNVDTNSIIQSGGDVQQLSDNTPTLTQQELKVAKSLRMTPEVYAKWRDKK